MAVQWLGLCALTAKVEGSILVGELRSCKPCGVVKKKKKKKRVILRALHVKCFGSCRNTILYNLQVCGLSWENGT